MNRLCLLVLAAVMSLSLVACGGDTEVDCKSVSLVDITTDQGISMKIPSDMPLQEDTLAYKNEETGDNVAFTSSEEELVMSEWTEADVLDIYQSKHPDVTVERFENGLDINGREALVYSVNLTTPGGSAITMVVVFVTDGTTNYVVNFVYGRDNADSFLVSNLQTCIDSITIA